MSQARQPIIPVDEDWSKDEPDIAVIEALAASSRPEHAMRARELVLRKIGNATRRAAQVAAGVVSRPPPKSPR